MSIYRASLLTLTLILLAGCQGIYYSAMEQVGIEKREILTSRVEDARDAQSDAEAQFRSAREQLAELIDYDGGDLEGVYDRTRDEYEDSKAAADAVSERIEAVDSVANALFDEWEDELDQYQNARMKRESAQKLAETQRQYDRLLTAMRRAESRMTPVLATLNDNVLYLKHNLNANTIGALEGEYRSIRTDIDELIREMESAIAASDAFLATLN